MVQLQPMVVELLVETVRIRQDKLRSNCFGIKKKSKNTKVHQRTSNNKFVISGIWLFCFVCVLYCVVWF